MDAPNGAMQQPAAPQQEMPKKQQEGGMSIRERDNFSMAPPMRMQNLVGQLQSEIDSIMGAFGSPFFSPFSSDLGRPLQMMDRLAPMMAPGGGNMMAMDVTEDEKQFTIQAEVPGFTKEDIKVSLSPDQMLTVSGSMKEEDKGEEGGSRRRILRMSSFTRRLQLPTDADMDNIKANTNHGVLTICVPKTGKPAAQMRDIPVE
ncbi:MAG: hypothetical protein WDW36_003767 [Sanguina aurantia]